MNAAATKLRMAAGPAISMAAPDPKSKPVPIEPPTATMAIWEAESWWRSPSSWICGGAADAVGMLQHSMNKRDIWLLYSAISFTPYIETHTDEAVIRSRVKFG